MKTKYTTGSGTTYTSDGGVTYRAATPTITQGMFKTGVNSPPYDYKQENSYRTPPDTESTEEVTTEEWTEVRDGVEVVVRKRTTKTTTLRKLVSPASARPSLPGEWFNTTYTQPLGTLGNIGDYAVA